MSRRFFTLYFIPLIPLGVIGEYIECQHCSGTYKVEVLQHDPEADARRHKAQFAWALRPVLAAISQADGRADDAKLTAIAGVLAKLEDREPPRAEIEAELAHARESQVDIVQSCREMTEYLNESGCELVVRSAILVASAGGKIGDNARVLVGKVAAALHVSPTRLAALLPEASREPQGGTASSLPS